MQHIYEKRVLKKAHSLIEDESHPLLKDFELLPSGSLFRAPKIRTNRFRNSFIPSAISLLNKSRKRIHSAL